MSFVGTRPEVVKYVKKYKPEYFATLLLPAGITSEAKDEEIRFVVIGDGAAKVEVEKRIEAI